MQGGEVSVERFREVTMGDAVLARGLVETFEHSASEACAGPRGRRSSAATSRSRSAPRIRWSGASANMGAVRLESVAAAMEQAAHQMDAVDAPAARRGGATAPRHGAGRAEVPAVGLPRLTANGRGVRQTNTLTARNWMSAATTNSTMVGKPRYILFETCLHQSQCDNASRRFSGDESCSLVFRDSDAQARNRVCVTRSILPGALTRHPTIG